MRKFNSSLAIIAVALTSVFGFTSCDKDNDAFNSNQQRIEMHRETTNSGTTTTTTINGQTTTTTTSASQSQTAPTAKDFAGTYKYTAADGKEWTIVLTENAGSKEKFFTGSITVPEGQAVDANTYEGEYKISHHTAIFYSAELTIGEVSKSIVSFGVTADKDNPKNAKVVLNFKERHADTLVFTKQ